MLKTYKLIIILKKNYKLGIETVQYKLTTYKLSIETAE